MVQAVLAQLEQDEHVVRQPADEKSSHQRTHDLEGLWGFGHPVGLQLEDDDGVADDDDDKRENKPCEEATECNRLVTERVRRVFVEANGPAHVAVNVTENHRGNAEPHGKEPRQENGERCLPDRAMVLGPNRQHDRHEAVDADDHQEEDAAEHVEEHDEGGEFAHEEAEDPFLQGRVGDAERQGGAEDKVGYGQAQVPGGVDRPLHLEARDPDDQSISEEAQQEDEHADHE